MRVDRVLTGRRVRRVRSPFFMDVTENLYVYV